MNTTTIVRMMTTSNARLASNKSRRRLVFGVFVFGVFFVVVFVVAAIVGKAVVVDGASRNQAQTREQWLARKNWDKHYQRVFKVLPAMADANAADISKSLAYLVELLDNPALQVEPAQRNEVLRWLALTKLSEDNCTRDVDRKLYESAMQLKLRRNESKQWNLVVLLDLIRSEQYKVCAGSELTEQLTKLVRKIPATSVQTIASFRTLDEFGLNYSKMADYIRPPPSRAWAGFSFRNKLAPIEVKLKAAFADKVLDKCDKIMQPYAKYDQIIDYLARHPKPNDLLQMWFDAFHTCELIRFKLDDVQRRTFNALHDQSAAASN